ncbi:MAG: hypothetical protein OXC55_08820 [Chloroflexi bacterium]|nr:hypothetical protein [Chloroflexota bacterium]
MNSPQRERILVTVKTYPTLSKKYGELVCTAGLREDGSWVRIYPVPFRGLSEKERYSKFDWIECHIARNTKDERPESFRPIDGGGFHTVGHIDTSHNWLERRKAVLEKATVYDRLDNLIRGARDNTQSLAVFRPSEILDFVQEPDDRDWDPRRVAEAQSYISQLGFLEDNSWRETFEIVEKIPYKFSYRFKDARGATSKLKILDWELGALYRNCLRSSNGDESVAIEKVREKYLEQFRETDLHFFLGTTYRWHRVGTNPWVIAGVFPIPHQTQGALPLAD